MGFLETMQQDLERYIHETFTRLMQYEPDEVSGTIVKVEGQEFKFMAAPSWFSVKRSCSNCHQWMWTTPVCTKEGLIKELLDPSWNGHLCLSPQIQHALSQDQIGFSDDLVKGFFLSVKKES